jgi:hypothetical protein
MASAGQTDAQLPQSVHVEGSILYGVPSVIALTGHSGIQVPHSMQSDDITKAIKPP